VTFATLDRKAYFSELAAARQMVCALRSVIHAKTLAFVVMPDHVHWLLEPKANAVLARVVRDVKSLTAPRLNKHLSRSGKFWQDGFHDRALRREEDLKAVARYLISNPTRAGIARTVR